MTPRDVRNYFGTWVIAMEKLHMENYAYNYWVKVGYIPYRRQLVIERLTNGALKASKPIYQ